MKKFVFIFFLACLSLFGDEIRWEKDYSTAIQKAKAVKKPVMFIVSNHNCRFCTLFENGTLRNPKVIQKLNAHYVNAIAYIDEDPIFPRQLNVPGTPGTWFLTSNGEPMFEPVMGAVESDQFLEALETVKQEYKKMAKPKESK